VRSPSNAVRCPWGQARMRDYSAVRDGRQLAVRLSARTKDYVRKPDPGFVMVGFLVAAVSHGSAVADLVTELECDLHHGPTVVAAYVAQSGSKDAEE
jgi:hypothetical protein